MGVFRENALQVQKHYSSTRKTDVVRPWNPPPLLAQAMGAGSTLRVGDKVVALKDGKIHEGQYYPGRWEKAFVAAVNYDGTYDVEFVSWTPMFERLMKGEIKGERTYTAKLPNRKQMVYMKDWGADYMSAEYRLMKENNYVMSMPASRIKVSDNVLSDTMDSNGNQDWFLCTSQNYTTKRRIFGMDAGYHERLKEYQERFIIKYEWVDDGEGGLMFKPTPTMLQRHMMHCNHRSVSNLFGEELGIEEETREMFLRAKNGMREALKELREVRHVPGDRPTRPAGPRTDQSLSRAAIAARSAMEDYSDPVAALPQGGSQAYNDTTAADRYMLPEE